MPHELPRGSAEIFDIRRFARTPRERRDGHDRRSSPWTAELPLAGSRVRLLEEHPDLAAQLDPRSAVLARHDITARATWLEPGPWTALVGTPDRYSRWLGVLVLDGLLSRTVAFERLTAQELVGPGDLLRPWDDHGATSSVPFTREWRILERTRIALLDEQVVAAACRWPPVVTALVTRTVDRARAVGLHLAIAQARQADVRLLLLFWHLADRWGHVSASGTIVPVALTHERIAELVCLRRPTVSMTLQRLSARGELVRRADGSWLLPKPPPAIDELPHRLTAAGTAGAG